MGGKINASDPAVPFYSSVTCKTIKSGEELGPEYWVNNLVSPVRFSTAVSQIVQQIPGRKTFLEIGPHSALAGPVRQILKSAKSSDEYLSVLTRGGNSHADVLNAVGQLWSANQPVDLAPVVHEEGKEGRFLVDLPLYPWHYEEPMWYESRLAREWRHRKFPHHDILGSRILETTDANPGWRNMLRLESVPWIKEHEVTGDIVFPGVGYVCMAGEAVRQLTNSESTDFTVRRVHIKAALTLVQDTATEVVTQLQRVPLTNAADSAWYSFSISSYQKNGGWLKHAFGQVSAGSQFPHEAPSLLNESLPRAVSRKVWYRKLRELGLEYGPRFLGLKEISAHPIDPLLMAHITNDVREGESLYNIHPAVLDTVPQAMAPALTHGLTRRFDRVAIPTYIGEMYVRPLPASSPDMTMQVRITEKRSNVRVGDIVAVSDADGQVVIDVKDLQMSVISEADDNGNSGSHGGEAKAIRDPHAAVELEWKRDVNLADVGALIHPANDRDNVHALLDRFAALSMRGTSERLRAVEPKSERPHLAQFREWLEAHCDTLPSEEVQSPDDTIETLYAQLQETEAHAAATAIHRIATHCESILEGTTDELALLLEDDVLHRLYDFMQNSEYSTFLDLVAHRRPNLRVLEIGAGTGGTTATVLPVLAKGSSAYAGRMYHSYTYTDVSSGFFPAAKERFKSYDAVQYAVLDISKDPLEQGFEAESFDLVIACNVLHATPNLGETLTNVRKLMHPRGRLFLQELSPKTKWINFVMGVLPGWWLGAADSRVTEPYVDSQRWDAELQAAGFASTQAVAYDGYLNNNIIATPALPQPATKRVTLLHSESSAGEVDEVRVQLESAGFHVDLRTLDALTSSDESSEFSLPAGQDVVSVVDLNPAGPMFHDLAETQLARFQELVRQVRDGSCGVLWVTGASQVGCADPRFAPVLGVARVVRTETGIDFATLELDSLGDVEAVPAVLAEFQTRLSVSEETITPNVEWASVNGQVLISRYQFVDVLGGIAERTGTEEESEAKTTLKLEQHRPGLVNTLFWEKRAEAALGEHDVRVNVRAVGLNFKDVLVSLGVVAEPYSIGRGMGYECSGIVTAVGSGVRDVQVGDRVTASTSGSFTTSLVVSDTLCAKMPDSMSFEEGASMLAVYCTAIYCLLDAAHLSKGMSVLIHSAAGGVGMAAIQVAKMVGAETYCTVGNESKAEFLVSKFGVPRERIFHSRDASFLPAVLKATGGRGVDVVLNSLSGELLHASWKCVAHFGTFVEIGRRDFIGHGQLAMELFEANRAFVGFDLLRFSNERPEMVKRLIERALEFYTQGHVRAIEPLTTFPATELAEAIRFMQKAQHMGKIVVNMPESPAELEEVSEEPRKSIALRDDAAYLFVGGLGGLGRSISTWLAERGARHFVFLSRSAGSMSDDDPFVRELASMGCTATRVSGDVTRYSDVVRAIKEAGRPIAGVLQASMVLRDNSLVDLSWEEWITASRPKIQGTWNLHNALLQEQPHHPLDLFLLFSSAGAMSGQWGQANYNAGNTFLDAFVQYRHSLGLAASALNIGVIGDVGYVSENTDVLDSLRATSQYITEEPALLDAIELMLKRSAPQPLPSPPADPSNFTHYEYAQHSQLGIGLRSMLPITSPANRTVWRKDPRFLVYRNLEETGSGSAGSSSSSDEELTKLLREASSNITLLRSPETAERLALELRNTLLGFLMRSDDDGVDLDGPLASVGIDSLISIELRNWVRRRIGAELTVLEIVRAASLRELGSTVQRKLVEKYEARMK